ncbi:hypothetical protein DEU56DRAFT_49736 [Suillus clintonianus]|uniref:uncharacterized protein n=1 Tax=Suillus clintonianus TaxID=1904413 RepID=UPI001B87D229|nr:uncharacterized protein DEU56DRAFT_49736 [Suillus clintonianus]KAG2123484.1 hypothetical protein DEU56DRAFT_49736 [Suillus clintonianus]
MIHNDQRLPNPNSVDNLPLMPLDGFHSHSSPRHSLSGHQETMSDPQNSRFSLLPDEEPFYHHQETSGASHFQNPIRPQLFRQSPTKSHRDIVLKGTWQLTKTFIVPFITIAYLTFCYTVQYRVVRFKGKGLYDELDDTWLAIVKSGLTTISIIIVSISLYPVYDLLSSLKSEEFFRVLRRRPQGIPLSAINSISNPSCGTIETIMLIIHKQCSRYFVTAFVAAGIAWVASALAPAALSIQPVLADGDIQAFLVGAVPPLSFYRPTASEQTIPSMKQAVSPGYPASIAWAEMALGMSYAYTISSKSLDKHAAYLTPMPTSIQASTSARWLSDVVGLDPFCTWANAVNLTKSSSSKAMNSSSVASTAVTAYLLGLDLDISVPSSLFPVYKSKYVTRIYVLDPTIYVKNHTTHTLPSDGSTTFAVIACTEGCTGNQINIYPDFTDIPTLQFTAPNNTYELAFLVCKPNIVIETREVRTQGSFIFEVQPLPEGKAYPRQGNLDHTQTSFMLSIATSVLSSDSGPQTSAWFGLGSETQVNFLFSDAQMNAIDLSKLGVTITLQPVPLKNLTQGYTQIVQAAAKAYITGGLGTAYVPARVSRMQLIFASSLPHVILATVAFALLWALNIYAHFRQGKYYDFTLVNVGAALHNSEIPEQFSQMKTHAANQKIPHSRWIKVAGVRFKTGSRYDSPNPNTNLFMISQGHRTRTLANGSVKNRSYMVLFRY